MAATVVAHALHDASALGLHPATLAVAIAGILVVTVALPHRAQDPLLALPDPTRPTASDPWPDTSPSEVRAGWGRRAAGGAALVTLLAVSAVGLFGPRGPNLASLLVANVLLPATVLAGLLGRHPRRGATWPDIHPLTWLLLAPVALTHALGAAGGLVAGAAVLGYLVLTLLGRWRTGPDWWANGDPFGVLLGLVARLSPRSRTAGAAQRGWLHALWAPVTGPQRWVLATVLAAGLARAARFVPAWTEVVGGRPPTLRLLAAAALVAYVLALLVLLERTVERRHGSTLTVAAIALVAAVVLANDAVPAAFSLHLAGTLVSDPFGTGADLFGTADRTVSTALLASPLVWLFQLVVVLVGGAFAATVQRDRERARGRTAPGPAVAVVAVTGIACGLLLVG